MSRSGGSEGSRGSTRWSSRWRTRRLAGQRGAARRGTVAGAPAQPTARRLRRARFGDLRLWLGIGLVIVAMLVGSAVMTAGADTVTVMRAERDLSVGSAPVDLVPVAVSRSAAGDAYLTGAPPAGSVLRAPVRAGEFVPRSALVPDVPAGTRLVTVPVDPLHAPAALQPGDLVDVWASQQATSSEPGAAPRPVLSAVTVSGVSADARGLAGEVAVVLEVADDDVAELVSASRSTVIDLVAVPLDSQVAADVTLAAPWESR